MNDHLFSFIIVMISWVTTGVFFGVLIALSQPRRAMHKGLWIPFMTFMAVLIGVIVTCSHALPETGLALNIMWNVFFTTAIFSFVISSAFRDTVIRKIMSLSGLLQRPALLKGGER